MRVTKKHLIFNADCYDCFDALRLAEGTYGCCFTASIKNEIGAMFLCTYTCTKLMVNLTF